MEMEKFLEELSSSAPTPGGGGVAALAAALASSLYSMVANLTSGKKKYEQYQSDIEDILIKCSELTPLLYSYIKKDAESFEPLSKAYGIPKDEPGRDEILQKALYDAAITPLELMRLLNKVCDMLKELQTKGSKLAVSDVAVSAAMLSAAAKSAVMNVYINSKLMKNREVADKLNLEANAILEQITTECANIYSNISDELQS